MAELSNGIIEYVGIRHPEVIANGHIYGSALVRYPGRNYMVWSQVDKSDDEPILHCHEAPEIKQVYSIGTRGGLLIEARDGGPVIVTDRLNIPGVYPTATELACPSIVSAYLNDGLTKVFNVRHGLEVTNRTGLRVQLYSNRSAFVALFPGDGKLLSWGDTQYGGSIPDETAGVLFVSHVVDIYPHVHGFLARTREGRVIMWGQVPLPPSTEMLVWGISDVFTTHWGGFAAYNPTEKKMITWGRDAAGGAIPDSVQNTIHDDGGVFTVVATSGAFAALTNQGVVVTWGHPLLGGSVAEDISEELRDVEQIISCNMSFIAIKRGGRGIVVWGAGRFHVPDELHMEVHEHGVQSVHSNPYGIAIKLGNNQCIAWRVSNKYRHQVRQESFRPPEGRMVDIYDGPCGFMVVHQGGQITGLLNTVPAQVYQPFLQWTRSERAELAHVHNYIHEQLSAAIQAPTIQTRKRKQEVL